MGDTIRKFKTFPFYDYPGVEQYLEDMALQGWMLKKYSWGIWKFRKAEPQTVHYEVVYDRWEDQLPGERETQRENVTSGEWKEAAQWNTAVIWQSKQESPCAIGGDAANRLAMMHKYKGYKIQFGSLVAILLSIIMLVLDLYEAAENPVKILSLNTKAAFLLLWLMFLVTSVYDWLEYKHWRKAMTVALQTGTVLDSRRYQKRNFAKNTVTYFTLGLVLLSFGLDDNWGLILLFLLLIIVLSAGCKITEHIVYKFYYSTEVRNFAVCVVIVLLNSLFFYGVSSSDTVRMFLVPDRGPDAIVTIGGMPCSVYTDPMLITADQLGFVTEEVAYSQQMKENESFLLKRTLAKQEAAGFSTAIYHDQRPPEISYELVDVKAGFLYDICKDSVENRLITHVRQGHLYNSVLQSAVDDFAPTTLEAQYSKVEALSDDMVSVYRIEHQENDDAYGYLLLWPDRIAAVCMTYEASGEQLAIIIDAMAPTK